LFLLVSGVRGIVGSTLTPQVVVKYVESFAALFPGKKGMYVCLVLALFFFSKAPLSLSV
jgi:hypothetical protein